MYGTVSEFRHYIKAHEKWYGGTDVILRSAKTGLPLAVYFYLYGIGGFIKTRRELIRQGVREPRAGDKYSLIILIESIAAKSKRAASKTAKAPGAGYGEGTDQCIK
jgi:hypothetical protein